VFTVQHDGDRRDQITAELAADEAATQRA